ncbi:alkaline exonuclease [Porcine lymphotropic herpesvirus 2]|uniref:Alkaline exonuclease n=1 Tax=Suid gammaherpesvirus 4 TaxID=1960250 RepID=Q8B3V6_9GAMA|nr:alkaline exonuclease [Porcine lymphotropic herpesvirus 2]AAO12378.1 alkaline exonuclease [Porcine lymphotropic herpesvirus 2]
MDILDNKTFLDEVSNLEIGEQLKKISEYTFSNFLRSAPVQEAIASKTIVPEMPAMRFVYLYYLFRKIQSFIGDEQILRVYDTEFKKNNIEIPTLKDVVSMCNKMDITTKTDICLMIENMTRGQSENILWEILRDGVISSSKLLKVIKQQAADNKIFDPLPIQKNHYVASPIAFGVRNENTVKLLLTQLIAKESWSNTTNFGFMLSPIDGIFGVSLDMCLKASVDVHNKVVFSSLTEIYEIKCRYKYLFSKSEFDPIYTKYDALYNSPCKATLVDFISSIPKPAVEHVPRGRVPTQNDYLLSFDKIWNFNPRQKKRKMTNIHKLTEQCMKYNCYTESKVIILTDPALTSGNICIKDTFFVDLYINPRHAYYYQILLQYKIVTNYIQFSQNSGSKLGKPETYIVTAFFRKRDSSDFKRTYIKTESNVLDPSLEIPVLLIITPVFIPHDPLIATLQKAIGFWQKSVQEEFPFSPWACSSLCALGDITP